MSRLEATTVEPAAPPRAESAPIAAGDRHEARNFFWLMAHQVMLRIGWIFKTESIVIPAFLDFLGGGAALRGTLPVFQRLGFSVPPLLYATRLKVMPLKKHSVMATTLAMAGPFAVLSALWFTGAWRGDDDRPAAWMPMLFFALYGVFFGLTGVNQLGANALQGKLVRPDLRGRLFTASVLVGSPLAIAAAAWLLPSWLAMEDGGFGWVFAAVAASFLLAGLAVGPSAESPDDFTEQSTNPWQKLHGAWSAIRSHADGRAIGLLAALVSVNFMLFPHYQAIGRERFGLSLTAMTLWVCVQNAATAAVSLVAGPLADRYGNRLALHFSTLGLSVAPVGVLVMLGLPEGVGRGWYWLVFAPLGFTPVTVRLLINYTLEIAANEDHPRYISAIGMCLALPVIVGSPLMGWLIGVVGSGPVFAGGLLLLLAAAAQTFRLSEPRHASR